jgi:hypothetical protein
LPALRGAHRFSAAPDWQSRQHATFDELGDLSFQPITQSVRRLRRGVGPPAQSIGNISWTCFRRRSLAGFSNGYIGGTTFTGIFMQFNQVLSAAAFACRPRPIRFSSRRYSTGRGGSISDDGRAPGYISSERADRSDHVIRSDVRRTNWRLTTCR